MPSHMHICEILYLESTNTNLHPSLPSPNVEGKWTRHVPVIIYVCSVIAPYLETQPNSKKLPSKWPFRKSFQLRPPFRQPGLPSRHLPIRKRIISKRIIPVHNILCKELVYFPRLL